MKTVDMYEIDEQVYIKAKITNIEVVNGELKYKLKTDFANNDISHLFATNEIVGSVNDTEITPVSVYKLEEDENEEPLDDVQPRYL